MGQPEVVGGGSGSSKHPLSFLSLARSLALFNVIKDVIGLLMMSFLPHPKLPHPKPKKSHFPRKIYGHIQEIVKRFPAK